MTLQTVTVTWDETDPAGNPASGSVSFQLTAPLIDPSGQVAETLPKTYFFTSGTGTSDPLVANDSSGALPTGTAYRITVALAGQQARTFISRLLFANGSTQTLGYLEANAAVPAAQYAQFLPLPSGTPLAGYVPAVIADDSTATQWVAGGGGGGGVSSVSVATANGFSGTVANPTTTPAISVKLGFTSGLVKAATGGTAAAATAGTDYVAPTGSGAGLTGITVSQVSGAAPLASPALTGSPTAPTQTTGDNSTKIATDAFVTTAVALLAPLASPALTGTPTAPTASALTDSTQVATTAYADAAVTVETSRAETAEALLAPKASPTFTGTVTVPATVNATDAAQKAYVDSVAQGLDNKPSVTALASANITLSGTQTVDGVALSAGNRVLATGQSTASQNGIWTVASGSWTRPADFASGSTQLGASVFVEGGTANGSSGWVLTGTTAVTVDTSSQTWTQFSGAGEITAGTGLSKSGNTLSLSTPVAIANGGTGSSTAAQNAVFAGPTSGSGAPSFRALAAADVPTLNQNTTGTASNITDTLDQVPAPAANVSLNSHKVTSLANGTAAQDAAAFGQIPTALPPNGSASGDLSGTYPGPTVAKVNGAAVPVSKTIVGTNSSGQLVDASSATLANNTTGTAANLTGAAVLPSVAPTVITLTDGSSVAIDVSQGNDFRWPLGGSSHTLGTPSNPVNGKSITIAIKYGGSFTPLFTSAVYDFGAAGQPSWSAASGKTDYVGFRYDSLLNGNAGAWAYQGSILGLTS